MNAKSAIVIGLLYLVLGVVILGFSTINYYTQLGVDHDLASRIANVKSLVVSLFLSMVFCGLSIRQLWRVRLDEVHEGTTGE